MGAVERRPSSLVLGAKRRMSIIADRIYAPKKSINVTSAIIGFGGNNDKEELLQGLTEEQLEAALGGCGIATSPIYR